MPTDLQEFMALVFGPDALVAAALLLVFVIVLALLTGLTNLFERR